MESADNSIEKIKYRKYSKRLAISGLAMIMLSVWSFFRFGLELYSERHILKTIINEVVEQTPDMTQNDGTIILAVILVMLFAVLFLSVLFHLFIGIQAIRDGYDRKNTVVYLILAVLVAYTAVASLGNSDTFLQSMEKAAVEDGETESEDILEIDEPEELEEFTDIEDVVEDPDDMFEETEDTIVNDEDTVISSFILDVTTLIICFEMLYCSIRKRILRAARKG